MPLPNYPVDPGIPGSLTDIIQKHPLIPRSGGERSRWFHFISGYQGETDYESYVHGMRGVRFTWRYARVPWLWGYEKEGRSSWNYPDEETFHRSGPNASWGILHQGNEPVSGEMLDRFREDHAALAVTGYYNHHLGTWSPCEPTRSTADQPSRQSWIDSGAAQRFYTANPMLSSA